MNAVSIRPVRASDGEKAFALTSGEMRSRRGAFAGSEAVGATILMRSASREVRVVKAD